MGRSASTGDVLSLFGRLDRIQSGVLSLGAAGADLRAEHARIESVHNVLRGKALLVDRVLARAGEWDRVRGELEPGCERWWWFLDERVARLRAQRRQRTLGAGAAVAAVLVALGLLYVRFLRPDQAVRTRIAQLRRGESLVAEGDYEAALAAYAKVLEVAPSDPEAHLMLGVVREAMAQPERAAAHYARAETLYGRRAVFLAELSQRYHAMGWYEASEAAAQDAIALDAAYAIAYCHLGSAHEAHGRIPEAIAAVRRCAELALEQEQDELYVTASVRLSVLLRTPAR